ncbi:MULTISPECIES: hypothetical protein [Sphingomonas]|nr:MULTISPECIES: hypothetical protein [Sphingomonas]
MTPDQARRKIVSRNRRQRLTLAAELIAFMLLAVVIGFARSR